MPQLEQIGTYLGQVVWLIMTFSVLFLVLWKAALPRIADILQERQERIDDDLQKAEAVKKEAQSALEAYERTVADARAQAQAILRESSERFAVEAAARHEEIGKRLAEEAAAAETRIEAARDEALANVREVSGDVTRAAVSRLVEIDVSEGDAAGAVAETMPETMKDRG